MPDLDTEIREALSRLTDPIPGSPGVSFEALVSLRRRRAARRAVLTSAPFVLVCGLLSAGLLYFADNNDSTRVATADNDQAALDALSVVATEVVGGEAGMTRVVMQFDHPLPEGEPEYVEDITSVAVPAGILFTTQDPEAAHVCGDTHNFGAGAVGTVDVLIPSDWFATQEGAYTSVLDRIGEPPKFVACGPYRGFYQYSIWGPASADVADVTVSVDPERSELTVQLVASSATNARSDALSTELTDTAGEETTFESEQGDVMAGTWDRVPTSLGGSELVPLLVPFEDRVFVLYSQNGGGDVAGEVYDPASGTAAPMGESGQVWRYNPAVAWTGTELLMVGGSSGPAIEHLALAYEPDAGEWRTLSNPPGDFDAWDNSIGGPGVWTGDELLIWQSGLALDPTTETWRALAPYPGPQRAFPATIWTGAEIIVWGGCDASIPQCDDLGAGLLTDGMIYNPDTDTWREMAPSPLAPGVHPVGAYADREVILYAGKVESDSPLAHAAGYDLPTDTWTTFEAPPLEPRRYAAGAWTGKHFVLWGGEQDGETWYGDGAALNPRTGSWVRLPDPPPRSERDRHAMAWIGDQLYIVGGWRTNGPIAFTPGP